MSLLMLLSLAVAVATSLMLVPVVRHFCRLLGVVDKPDAERKLQSNAVSLGGGLAVFASVCVTFTAVLLCDRYFGDGVLGVLDQRWHVLFYSAAALMLIGLFDDAFTLRGRQKLLLQILVVVGVVGGGTVVQTVRILGTSIDLGVFAFPLTVIWLLAAINALNLLDGADGMASTAGSIISGGLAILCFQTNTPLGAVVAAALCGSLLGFLVFNRPPASIYLGDAGSMVIGLFVGVLSIWGSVKGSALASVAPLLVLTLPLFDSSIAILRRVLTGRSIYATDRAHLHHRLLDRFSHPMMLVVVASLCTITSITSILSVTFQQQWIAFFGVALVIALLVLTRSFGNAELHMLVKRGANFGESLLVRSNHTDGKVHQKTVQLQGNRQWDAIWNSLVEFAMDRHLSKIKLDLSIAWMQEGYHGSWQRSRLPEKSQQLVLKMPLYLDTKMVGRIEVIASAQSPEIMETLDLLSDRFRELQHQVQFLVDKVATNTPIVAIEQSVPSNHATNSSESTDEESTSTAVSADKPLPYSSLGDQSPGKRSGQPAFH